MKTGNGPYFCKRSMISVIFAAFCFVTSIYAQGADESVVVSSSRFRVGEKLTYNVSFGKFSNAAYAEMSVVSTGKLDGKEVVELTSRLKMLELVSAAFFQFDEDRTVYAAPETGLPLYVSKILNFGVLPKETVGNYLKEPTLYFDLLSLVYKAREVNGAGAFPLFENERLYTVTFQPGKPEKIKTEAGEFDTVASVVQSEYLTEKGITDAKINFATVAGHLPVLIRLKTVKGVFTASLAAVQLPKPAAEKTLALTPTPAAPSTPKPPTTPAPYIENQPLSPELGFALGESLDYKVTDEGRPVATISLSAKERKLIKGVDSLLLSAVVTGIEQFNNNTFVFGDSVHAHVDPETLAPFSIEKRFAGELKNLNQTVTFDPKSGNIAFGGANNIDAPIGTHTILSLLYAMRSFNLKPSKDSKNPVNDTRVAVFWEAQPYVFTLRPSNPEEITVSGEKIQAQLIAVTTGNDVLDKQGLKIWLTADSRVPVRFSFGSYQADLVSPSKNLPK
ncbi:MAG: DUF3108 domain-containing protein [Pyrinomonadaceae bacterium]